MIRAENITKYYPTNTGRHYVFRDASVEIPSGAQVGVLGVNGAGKSTLMRMLAGVDVPNRGRIIKWGTISWPLGIANCVQAPMTGRENARFACRIQGLQYDDTPPVIEFVRSFADIGSYFDMPVRTYSSGMRARLSFGITMAFDFDFYIIDEVTGAGDRTFKKKAREMFEAKRRNAGFIRTSHNTNDLRAECSSGLVLHKGKMEFYPTIEEAIDRYTAITGVSEEASEGSGRSRPPRKARSPAPGKSAPERRRDKAERSQTATHAAAKTDAAAREERQ